MCSPRFRRWLCVTTILLFAVSPITVFADCGPTTRDDSGSRPRVGLALSGGGARGAAHIGVIRVLLEEGVAIDCIAGTSMGAIVGGLYASGMTLEELGFTEEVIPDYFCVKAPVFPFNKFPGSDITLSPNGSSGPLDMHGSGGHILLAGSIGDREGYFLLDSGAAHPHS